MPRAEFNKLKNYTLLVAEDEQENRTLLCNYLRQYVKEIYEAGDGVEALKLFEEKKPDIIVTDIIMPNRDGLEFIEKVKKSGAKTPFIFTTAYNQKDTLVKVIESSPSSFLTKPLNMNALLNALLTAAEEIETNVDCETGRKLNCGGTVDFQTLTFSIGAKKEKLSKKEAALLKLVCDAKGSIVSYELIEKTVWRDNNETMSKSALNALIHRLRKKTCKECISVIPGMGVKLGG